MSQVSEKTVQQREAAEPIAFSEHYATSAHFQTLYQDGMRLVEQTATYLDGEGRREARNLDTDLSLAYATESMRLTTRLMQVSSWLLIRRALNDKTIDRDQARAERRKVQLEVISRPGHVRNFEQLPARLQELVIESYRILDIVKRLDGSVEPAAQPVPVQNDNPVATQVDRVRLAFSA
ncbi:MAG: DUF1465 family protein [Hyphomicrobiaceae bacterium]